ncbi:prepilin peptidase [Simiduia aestuariiviva]|uniref:Prepilin leader peptidase/N-methyltransferase n=1 Tax=Simiduia aestuariiviva TaxID=1510459 RepID=A0A839URG6_9GAMM|nr:A24 family peptidase [Simiduia aestuariiviva]MBB3169090.1 leader peptidase (prepilin peptidase)/N-methyltransferase [Simiduia aestuariiviva]
MPQNDFLNALQEPWLYIPAITVLGLMIGSFLNVVIYRLPLLLKRNWQAECCELMGTQPAEQPQDFNLAFPNSHCPQCKAAISPLHNVPIISYLVLGGKCHACRNPISIRYPLIELTTALLSLAVAWHLGASLEMLVMLPFTWALITLTMIDADTMLLPDDITLPLLWAGLIINSFGWITDFQSAFWGAVLGYGVLWSVFWLFKLVTGKEGMGYGDFKLLAALGAWLGWQALPLVILLSSLVGAVIGISMIMLRGQDKQIPIPFGPYLAIAGWIAMMWGDQITAYYLAASGISGQ